MVPVYLFIVKYSELPLLQMPSCHPSPLHATGCSMLLRRKDHSFYQKSTNQLVVCHRLPHLPHCQTHWKLLETSATSSRSRQTCPPKRFGQKGGKGKFNWLKLQHGQTISAEPRVHLGHNSSGQVRYRPMLTIIPRFSLQKKIFLTHSHFAATTMPVPLPWLWGQRESCAGESNHKHLWELRQIKSYLWRKTVTKFLY